MENAEVEPETRSHFHESTVMWATLGDSEPTSSGFGGCYLVEGVTSSCFSLPEHEP